MRIWLERCKVWTIVDGTEPAPVQATPAPTLQALSTAAAPQLAPNQALIDWQERDLQAQLEIIMHLSDKQVPSIQLFNTSKEIWDHLKHSKEI